MKPCYESIYLPLSLKKLLIKRCILIDFSHSDQRWQNTREMAAKHMKTRQFPLGSRCLVRMNFCLIFLICNSGRCLIRVIIKHYTMLAFCCIQTFCVYLTVCEFICCSCLSFSLTKKKKEKTLLSPKKETKWLRQVQLSTTSLFWTLESNASGI